MENPCDSIFAQKREEPHMAASFPGNSESLGIYPKELWLSKYFTEEIIVMQW